MTKTKKLHSAAAIFAWGLLLPLAGCQSAAQVAPPDPRPPTEAERATQEAQSVAAASLGKQAEVLDHGDLALNGMEQVLAVDRLSTGAPGTEGSAETSAVLVTRAAVLEKNGGKWSQILLCDEHLKNPKGYLGGSVSAVGSGWRLEYRQDPKAGLVMMFTPAVILPGGKTHTGERSELKNPSFDVRWNKNAKRYQTFDQSKERYLNEVPSLEPTESILK